MMKTAGPRAEAGRGEDLPQVLVVGGGFGGLAAIRALDGEPVSVTVVDRKNHHLFQPLLYQVATAALDPSSIAYPIRSILRRQKNVERVLLASVEAVDAERRLVRLDDGSELPFDKLILATGATHSYFGHPEWEEHARGLKTLEDALEIRARVLAVFEEAERYPERREELLTFVVVGAGPTGVELAGALREIAVDALARDFAEIDPLQTRVVLVEGTERVLPVYPAGLSRAAEKQLRSLGVEVRLGALVSEVDGGGVVLRDGRRIPAATVLWAAGVRASRIASELSAERDRAGRVKVWSDLSLPGEPDVFVVGDLAHVESDGEQVPGVAPAAIQAGQHAAEQISRDLRGEARRPFRYRNRGNLATIGRARAVADLGRLRFSGLGAWLTWLLVHIASLIGFRNRVFVLFSWAWSYLTFRRGARLITEREGGRKHS